MKKKTTFNVKDIPAVFKGPAVSPAACAEICAFCSVDAHRQKALKARLLPEALAFLDTASKDADFPGVAATANVVCAALARDRGLCAQAVSEYNLAGVYCKLCDVCKAQPAALAAAHALGARLAALCPELADGCVDAKALADAFKRHKAKKPFLPDGIRALLDILASPLADARPARKALADIAKDVISCLKNAADTPDTQADLAELVAALAVLCEDTAAEVRKNNGIKTLAGLAQAHKETPALVVVAALRAIGRICAASEIDALAAKELKVPALLLDMAKERAKDESILPAVFVSAGSLVAKCPANFEPFVEANFVDILFKAVSANLTSAPIIAGAFSALGRFCYHEASRAKIVDAGIFKLLHDIMKKHSSKVDAMAESCNLLFCLADTKTEADTAFDKDDLKLHMYDIVKSSSQPPSVQDKACLVLAKLIEFNKGKDIPERDDKLKVILTILNKHPQEEYAGFQSSACLALARAADNSHDSKTFIMRGGYMSFMTQAFLVNHRNPEALANIFVALGIVSASEGLTKETEDLFAPMCAALKANIENRELQKAAFTGLNVIFEKYGRMSIPRCNEESLAPAIAKTFARNGMHPELVALASKTLEFLVSASNAVAGSVVEKEGAKDLCECFQFIKSKPEVVKEYFACLATICFSQDSLRQEVVKTGMLDHAASILDEGVKKGTEVECVKEAVALCGALGLSQDTTVITALGSANIAVNTVHICTKFEDELEVVEMAVQAVGRMCGCTKKGLMEVIDIGGMQMIFDFIKKYEDEEGIVKNCFFALDRMVTGDNALINKRKMKGLGVLDVLLEYLSKDEIRNDTMRQVLMTLGDVCQGDLENANFVLEKKAIKQIMTVTDDRSDNKYVLCEGILTLGKIWYGNKDINEDVATDCASFLAQMMQTYTEETPIMECTVRSMAYLLQSSPKATKFLLDEDGYNIVDLIKEVGTENPDSTYIKNYSRACMVALVPDEVKEDENKAAESFEDNVKDLIGSTDFEILAKALKGIMMVLTSKREEMLPKFEEMDGTKALLRALKVNIDKKLIVQMCLVVMSIDLEFSEKCRDYCSSEGLLELLVEVLRSFDDSSTCYQHALCSFFHLCTGHIEHTKAFVDKGGIKHIIYGLTKFILDEGVVHNGLRSLVALCRQGEGCAHAVLDAGAIEHVVEAIKAQPQSGRVQEHGFGVLVNLCMRFDEVVETVAKLEVPELVVAALKAHKSSPYMSKNAFYLTAAMCGKENVANRETYGKLGMFDCIKEILKVQMKFAPVVKYAMLAVANVSMTPKNAEFIDGNEWPEIIMAVNNVHEKNEAVCFEVVRAISKVVESNPEVGKNLLALDAVPVVVKTMIRYSENANFVQYSLTALLSLAKVFENADKPFIGEDSMIGIFTLLEKFCQLRKMQETGLLMFSEIAKKSIPDKKSLVSDKVLPFVSVFFTTYANIPGLVLVLCDMLINIGDRDDKSVDAMVSCGIIGNVNQLLCMYGGHPVLISRIINVYATLCCQSKNLTRSLLKNTQCANVIVTCMKNHLANVEVQRPGCKLLREFSMFGEQAHNIMTEIKAIRALFDAISAHSTDRGVVLAVLGAFSCISSSSEKHRTNLLKCKIGSVIETTMKANIKDASVQQQACKVLGNLAVCKDPTMAALVGEFHCITRCVEAMQAFPDNTAVCETAMLAIANLNTRNPEVGPQFVAAGGHKIVAKFLEESPAGANITKNSVFALAVMAMKCEPNAMKELTSTCMEPLVKALRVNELVDAVQRHGAVAFTNMYTANRDVPDTLLNGAIEMAVKTLFKFHHNIQLEADIVRCMTKMFAMNEKTIDMFADHKGANAILDLIDTHNDAAWHTRCVNLLLILLKKPEVAEILAKESAGVVLINSLKAHGGKDAALKGLLAECLAVMPLDTTDCLTLLRTSVQTEASEEEKEWALFALAHVVRQSEESRELVVKSDIPENVCILVVSVKKKAILENALLFIASVCKGGVPAEFARDTFADAVKYLKGAVDGALLQKALKALAGEATSESEESDEETDSEDASSSDSEESSEDE